MKTPISDRGVQRKSQSLEGLHLALGICGGIAAVETVKLARELRRHGARVTAFLTPSAPQFVGTMSVSWACGEPAIADIGADVDHLEHFDLVLVAPATLNTIARCALGLTDNAVTLVAASQLGRKAPLFFVPTMNATLAAHPMYEEHRKRLTSWGARFFASPLEEDRLKMPDPVAVVDAVVAWIGRK